MKSQNRSVAVVLSALAMMGCNAIIGASDHTLAPQNDAGSLVDSAVPQDANPLPDATPSADASPDTNAVADAAMDGGLDANVVLDASVDSPAPIDAGQDAIVSVVDSGTDAGTDSGTDAGCTAGALQCSGTGVPQKCVAGSWQNQTPCSGASPVCSGGVCGGYMVSGGIRSSAPRPLSDASVFLVSGGFELGTRTCTDAGLCVTGGIAP